MKQPFKHWRDLRLQTWDIWRAWTSLRRKTRAVVSSMVHARIFNEVVFAVFDRSEDEASYRAFAEIFR